MLHQNLKSIINIIVDLASTRKKEITLTIHESSKEWLLSVHQPNTEIFWSLSYTGHFLVADEEAISQDNRYISEGEQEDKTHFFKHNDGSADSTTCSFPYNMEGMIKAFDNMHSLIMETVNDWNDVTL